MTQITLFDIPILNTTMHAAVGHILHCLQKRDYTPIFFANAHCVNISRQDPVYRSILRGNPTNFADGIGMKLASKAFNTPLIDNINGTDMYPVLCSALNQTNYRVFLLGAAPGVAEEMREKTLASYPNIPFCGCHHGYFTPEENDALIETINKAKPDLLLVALGVPKQEKWIDRYGKQTNATVVMGVGGLFNFYSGKIPRAPKWMQNYGLEWLHRFWREPGRLWKRYLIGNLCFLLLLWKWKVKKRG